MDLLALYEETFGLTPRQFVLLDREVSPRDIHHFIDNWRGQLEYPVITTRCEHEIRPLISHHPFNSLSLFGSGPRETISERALSLLTAHDGLACSDPMWEIMDLRNREGTEAAASGLKELTYRFAGVERLIESGAIRFTSIRPALDTHSRTAVLRAFGVEPDMRVFSNFEQAADTASMFGGAVARSYIDQGVDLSFAFGILQPDFESDTLFNQVEETRQRVKRIGQAILHLSWQLSVASNDKSVDLTPGSEMEAGLLEYLLGSTGIVRPHMREGAYRTRHLLRTAAGEIPNIESVDLSDSDALAIRSDDSFAEFRSALHAALDEFESASADHGDSARAAGVFTARMADAAERLKHRVAKAPFSAVLKGSVIPVAIQAAVATFSASDDQVKAAALASGGTVASVLWSWLHARSGQEGLKVAIRYASTLGAARPGFTAR